MSFSVRQRGHILRATDAALLSMITVNNAHSGSKSVKRQSANTPYAGKSIDTHVIRHGSRLEASDQLPMEDKAGSDPQLTYHFPIVISHSNFQKFERNIVLRTGLFPTPICPWARRSFYRYLQRKPYPMGRTKTSAYPFATTMYESILLRKERRPFAGLRTL